MAERGQDFPPMLLTTQWRRTNVSKKRSRERTRHYCERLSWSIVKTDWCVKLRLRLQSGETVTFTLRKDTNVCCDHIAMAKKWCGKYMFKVHWKMGIIHYSLMVNNLEIVSALLKCRDMCRVKLCM